MFKLQHSMCIVHSGAPSFLDSRKIGHQHITASSRTCILEPQAERVPPADRIVDHPVQSSLWLIVRDGQFAATLEILKTFRCQNYMIIGSLPST